MNSPTPIRDDYTLDNLNIKRCQLSLSTKAVRRHCHTLACVLGFVFLLSGYMKLSQPDTAARFINDLLFSLHITQQSFTHTPLLIRWLSWFEIIAAFCVAIAPLRVPALAGMSAILIFGILSVLWMSAQGLTTNCGCFGDDFALVQSTPWLMISKNVLLLGLVASVYQLFQKLVTVDQEHKDVLIEIKKLKQD